jgi:WD repeat-containing protein 48
MAKAKVAYTLTCPGPGRHKFGVNGLVLVHNGPEQSAWAGAASLFTAGRDATVRRWDVSALEAGGSSAPPPAHAPACVATYADHSDWVNDIVVAREHGLLISASSDHTLKLWSLDTPGSALPKATVHTHTDYVKALAYAPAAGIVVSASLDKRIHIYQLDTLRQVALNGGRLPGAPSAGGPSASGIGGDYAGGGGSGGGGGGGGGGTVGAPGEWSSADGGSGPIVASGHVDSIYSVAVNSAGTLIASGSVEPEIRLWDARTGRRAAKLVGHSNLVRALVLDADGRRLLSASSDRTVRLWDVGSGRCIHTCRLHRDAAWALAVDADWRTAYSGGRDGAVIATDLGTWDSVLVACEQAPVVRLAAGREQLWCATTSSDVRSWPTAAVAEALRAGPAHGAAIDGGSWALRSSANGGSGSVSARRRLVTALAAKPLALIEGAAAVHSHTLLSDRWRVLAADTTGVVTLWDVLRCKPLATYGPGRSLDDVARELHVERAVPSWFSVDTRSGDLTIVLDERTAFAGLVRGPGGVGGALACGGVGCDATG